MLSFPFNEVSGLTMKLHNLQKGADPNKDHYVYNVSIYPDSCSFTVHMSEQMFEAILSTYPVGSYKVTTSILDKSVHLSATVDGSITLICCILQEDMCLTVEDLNKPIEQLYKEWVERTRWPYA